MSHQIIECDRDKISEECESRTIFASNLAYYIKRSGDTQCDIASKIGVASATLNNWVKGHKYPRPEKIEKLAHYFGITISDLVQERAEHLSNFNAGEKRGKIGRPNSVSQASSDGDDDETILLNDRIIMAQNIKYYMSLKGISRNQLCEELGFNYNTLSDWLQGEKYPRIDKISIMADYFGCRKSDLIEKKKENIDQPTIVLNNDVIELIELYQQCGTEQKYCLKRLLRFMVEK